MDNQTEQNLKFSYQYLTCMLDSVGELPEEQAKSVIKKCSQCHYKINDMDVMLEKYVGSIGAFIEFLEREWGWLVSIDEKTGIITADENKENCVCPIVNGYDKKKITNRLCYCSEGFAEKMFSKIAGCKIKAEVTASVLRGDKSCVYKISGVKIKK